eukprot:gene2779-3454_t
MGPTEKKELSSKDQAALKNISKLFDEKKYKKGLKAADEFLKTHPTNVDAQCFKCLTVYNMGKKDEAHEIAKKVLRTNLSSSMAWHTLGFLHKQERNFTEALKCFKNAHKYNKESSQIIKDLSNVQIYLRDLSGYRESYAALLTMLPNQKGHWIGLIVAYHLLGNYKQALLVLDQFFEIIDEKTGLKYTELILYKCMLLDEMGEYDQVLALLKKEEKTILDKFWAKQKQADILIKKKQFKEAEKIYNELIKLNPDNLNYHQKLWICNEIEVDSIERLADENKVKILSDIYTQLEKEHPKCLLIQKIPLLFLPAGELFREHLNRYSKHFLVKGIPSLFNNLKSLYHDTAKVEIIDQLFKEHLKNLRATHTLSGSDETVVPSTTLWCLYFLALHLNRLGKHSEALEAVEEAIKHTPTAIDLYIVKAKIYKHQGNTIGAFEEYDKARKLDLADRYLNTKACLYALRNNDTVTAETIFLAMKSPETKVLENMAEFQCMWYEKEWGSVYLRTGQYGKALRLFHLVDRHFSEFLEDQFDFHAHIQKRYTLRSYIEFLRWEDQVYQNKPYVDSAKLAIKTYMSLINKPVVLEQLKIDESLRPKPAQPAKQPPKPSADEDEQLKIDDTPSEEKLLSEPNFLVPATKFLKNLLKFSPNDLEVHALACQVYLAKKKYLIVLSSLLKIKSIQADHPLFYKYAIQFLHQIQNDQDIKEPVKQVIESEKEKLFGQDIAIATLSPDQIVQHITSKFKDSIPHKFIAGESLLLINSNSNKEKALELIMDFQGKGTWKNCFENYQTLHNLFSQTNPEIPQQYKEKSHQMFPNANHFQPTPVIPTTITAPNHDLTNGEVNTDL